MASQYRRFAAALMSSTALAGAGLLGAGPAFAQQPGENEQAVFLEADHLEDTADGSGYLAVGNVRVRQEGRTLLADELEYRPDQNRIIARGNVVIIGQTDFPQYADEVELDSAFSSGLALGFASMLENNGRIAAAAAIRRENGSMQLEDAYYTACELCESGDRPPTWRLRAREVHQDAEDQMIYYRDAQFEVMGVPVLYTPVFAHADPSTERRSGLLFPTVAVSSRLGFSYQQPYYWAISPSQDVTIAPRLMTNVNPLLYTEYRKRFWSGQVELEGSLTREFEIDSDGERFGEEKWRWHVFGGGRFDITEDWRWGFGVQQASDDLHLRRYDFSEEDKDRGLPLESQARQLVSQIYLDHRTEHRFFSAIAADYQSLRTNFDDDAQPLIAPMLTLQQVFDAPQGWGRINLNGSAVHLDRESGNDYSRGTLGFDWRTRWVTSPGIVIEPFAEGRADYYSLTDIPVTGGGTEDDSFSRALGLVGTDFSYPFFRGGETTDWIVEPLVSFVAATDDPERNRLINEDSLSVDLDESMLFRSIRAPGYDTWEDGQRVSYGMRATAFWGESGRARVFAGRSERLDGVAVFNPASGLFEENSDYVVAGEIDIAGFSAELTTRLDSEDADVNRLEFETRYTSDRMDVQLGYLDISDDAGTRGAQRELRADIEIALNDRWNFVTRVTRDLDLDVSRRQETGLLYRDECTQFEIVYERQDLGIARLGPSESIQFRVTLFTLGSLDPEN